MMSDTSGGLYAATTCSYLAVGVFTAIPIAKMMSRQPFLQPRLQFFFQQVT